MIPVRLPQKARKYRNEPIVVEGVRFDSTREAVRFHTLRLLERSGDVKNLKRQVRYPLYTFPCTDGGFPSGQPAKLVGFYVADMEYFDAETKQTVTEDVKSPATEKIELFRWKAKHFEAQYGRKIRVTT